MNYTYTVLAALAAASLSSCHTTLYNAAREGDVKTVREELADGADINKGASKANLIWQVPATVVAVPIDAAQIAGIPCLVTPIAYVLLFGENGSYQGKLKFLTKAVTEFGSETPMQAATNPDVITELLLAGAEGTGWDKSKAVTEAARRGDAVTLRKLMEKSCRGRGDWNIENDYKPLMLAIGGGHEECARILLEHGAKFTSTATVNKNTVDCYDYAVAKGQLELYKKLGGPTAASPASMAGKSIFFDHSKTKGGLIPIWTIEGNNGTFTTPVFANDNTSSDGQDNRWNYKKTGDKTASVEMNGCEVYATYTMTFDSMRSGTATCKGGDDGGGFSQKKIRFIIK